MNYDPHARQTSPAERVTVGPAVRTVKPPWEVGEILRIGWNAFKADWVVLLFAPGLALIGALLPLVIGVVAGRAALSGGSAGVFIILAGGGMLLTAALIPFVQVGLVRMAIAAARGQKSSFRVVFSGRDRMAPLFLVSLIMGVAIEIGLFFFVVPGVVLAIGLFFAPYFVVEENMSPLDALWASWDTTLGHKTNLFVFHVVAAAMLAVGELALGLGTFVAIPILLVGYATIYLRLRGALHPPSPFGVPPASPAAFGPPSSGPFGAPPSSGAAFGAPPPSNVVPAYGPPRGGGFPSR